MDLKRHGFASHIMNCIHNPYCIPKHNAGPKTMDVNGSKSGMQLSIKVIMPSTRKNMKFGFPTSTLNPKAKEKVEIVRSQCGNNWKIAKMHYSWIYEI
jgi:hypothetical protein